MADDATVQAKMAKLKSEYCQNAFFTIIYVGVFASNLYSSDKQSAKAFKTLS